MCMYTEKKQFQEPQKDLLISQLGESFKTIIYVDYPEQWQRLLDWVKYNLQNQQIYGALFVLRIPDRKYEFQSDEERTPVSSIVEETFPLLLTIFCDIIQIKNPRRVYEADMQNILVMSICKSAMRVVSCASLGRNYTFVVPKFNSLKYNSNQIVCV
ncbi:hypothetical protein YC2023_012503 [Brassica napus]